MKAPETPLTERLNTELERYNDPHITDLLTEAAKELADQQTALAAIRALEQLHKQLMVTNFQTERAKAVDLVLQMDAVFKALPLAEQPYDAAHEMGILGEGFDMGFAAAPSEPERAWQPMDTAPKDGTRILVRLVSEARYVTWQWNSDDPEDGGYWFNQDAPICHDDVGDVDGWLPLPPTETKV
jgi:hypothetical protein